MAKIQMEWTEFKGWCRKLSADILAFDPDFLVAVPRGGMTPAHVIAKMLGKKVGFYNPVYDIKDVRWMQNLWLPPVPKGKKVVKISFVEDLVATGRTFDEVRKYMNQLRRMAKEIPVPYEFEWNFNVILADKKYNYQRWDGMLNVACVSEDWVVFPWEDFDLVVDGDRGLFRNGDDSYGK
jgi:hypoxanthine phosphoribosyltransferase